MNKGCVRSRGCLVGIEVVLAEVDDFGKTVGYLVIPPLRRRRRKSDSSPQLVIYDAARDDEDFMLLTPVDVESLNQFGTLGSEEGGVILRLVHPSPIVRERATGSELLRKALAEDEPVALEAVPKLLSEVMGL